MSFEWVSFEWRDRWLPSGLGNVTRFNMKHAHTAAQEGGPTGLSATSRCRYRCPRLDTLPTFGNSFVACSMPKVLTPLVGVRVYNSDAPHTHTSTPAGNPTLEQIEEWLGDSHAKSLMCLFHVRFSLKQVRPKVSPEKHAGTEAF